MTQNRRAAVRHEKCIASSDTLSLAKSGLNQRLCLLLPALLVEAASVRQHDAALAFSVGICVDDASVLSWKGDVLLRHGKPRQKKESRKERSEGEHGGIVLPLVIDFRYNSRSKPRVFTDTAWADRMVVLLDICRGQQISAHPVSIRSMGTEHCLHLGGDHTKPKRPQPNIGDFLHVHWQD